MVTVDFSKINIKGIDGREQRVDINDELANLIYMQGQSIGECELGRRMYMAARDGEGKVDQTLDRKVNLSDEDVRIVERASRQFPYVIRVAIDNLIKMKQK